MPSLLRLKSIIRYLRLCPPPWWRTVIFPWLLLPAFLLALACKKNTATAVEEGFTIDGKVIYTGPIAADGCEWMVEVDSVKHELWHADNLDASYQVNQQKVHLTYHKVRSNWSCGQIPVQPADANKLNAIYIDEINKR